MNFVYDKFLAHCDKRVKLVLIFCIYKTLELAYWSNKEKYICFNVVSDCISC